MKKLAILTASMVLAGAPGAFAQGFIYNAHAINTIVFHVWGPETDVPSAQIQGNTSSDFPAGTTVYNGTLLGGSSTGATASTDYGNGTLWDVQVWAAPTTGSTLQAVGSLQPVAGTLVNMKVNSAANAGYLNYTGATDPVISSATVGGNASAQLRAWYNGGGAITSWALATANGVYGSSAIFNINGLGGGTVTDPNMVNATSFNVTSVTSTPEPSTIALGVIGASALLFRRRKN